MLCSGIGGHAAMTQLLVMLIVPPTVGLVTYLIVRLVQHRGENDGSEAVERHEPSEDLRKV